VFLAPPKPNPQNSNGRRSRFPKVRLFAAKKSRRGPELENEESSLGNRRHHEAQVT
jgi:hypothetical protein